MFSACLTWHAGKEAAACQVQTVRVGLPVLWFSSVVFQNDSNIIFTEFNIVGYFKVLSKNFFLKYFSVKQIAL